MLATTLEQVLSTLPTAERGLLAVRWHGRGGTGAKTGAVLLAELAIAHGLYGQALPEFGPERRGAPVQAFTRIATGRIAQRGPIARPDVVVVLDASLLGTAAVREGLTARTLLFVNAPPHARAALEPSVPGRLVVVDASTASRDALGRDLPNIPMLAAVVAGLDLLPRTTLLAWLEARLAKEFPPAIVAGNLRAAATVLDGVAAQPWQTPPPDGAPVAAPPRPVRAVLRWQDVATGAALAGGTSRQFATGDWRQQRPVLDLQKCIHCMLCWLYCPDSSIHAAAGRITGIDLTYCKGCGICAEVCPPRARAIVMVPEGA